MKTFAIIAAMEEELVYLRKIIPVSETKTIFGKTIEFATVENNKIILALAGIGKVNAAMTTTIIINNFNPDYIINTGSAGGIAEAVGISDVVIGKSVVQADVNITKFNYQIGQIPNLPQCFNSDENLIQAAKKAIEKETELKIHLGLISSADIFIDNEDTIERILTYFPDALCCEMEGGAIAQVAYLAKVPFIIIRSISDKANLNSNMDFKQYINQASENSAKIVIELIKSL